MATRRYQMFDWGYRVYEHIPYGFTAIDGNLFAAVSDEAQYVTTFSSTQRFNEGSWSAYYNPDDCYTSYYNGIYAAHDYLDKSVDYRYILGMHRDTLTSNGLDSYRRDIGRRAAAARRGACAESLLLFRACQALRRGAPHRPRICRPEGGQSSARHVRRGGRPHPARDRGGAQRTGRRLAGREPRGEVGRITRGAALALKSRVLLYAASPQFNPSAKSPSGLPLPLRPSK